MKPAILLLLTTILHAQSPQEVEITAEPHHHLVLANAQVRVFSVDVVPHTDTLMHWHRHDYIYVMFGQSEVVNAVQAKAPVPINLQDGQVGFAPAPFAHIVRNQDHPFRNVTIELLQDEQLHHSTHKWDEDRGLDILQGGTKQILWVKDGVRASEIELQPGGTAPKPAGAYLLVAVSDLRLDAADKPRNAPHDAWDQIDRKAGDSIWIPPVALHALTNTTQRTAKFVSLEFP
jgi:oxalate decarboxylase/phosphoglucose isomerase-like protein (cupin superfamily)